VPAVARSSAASPRPACRTRTFSTNARREAAERYLSESALSIAELAYLLGYSEPSAFHRAFKRWFGRSPLAFRERLRNGQRSRSPQGP
jgi:AraC-like DNA-binding protein